jgi:hypothetical protein
MPPVKEVSVAVPEISVIRHLYMACWHAKSLIIPRSRKVANYKGIRLLTLATSSVRIRLQPNLLQACYFWRLEESAKNSGENGLKRQG